MQKRDADVQRSQRAAEVLNALLFGICAIFLVRSFFVAVDKGLAVRCSIRCGYMGPQYYFSYGDGFERRGFPGSILAVFGGRSTDSVDAMGWSLVFAALAAVIALAVLVFIQLRETRLRYAAAALVLLCPLSAS